MVLTGKQEAFAQNIAKGYNMTESAIKAGYAKSSAHVNGSRTMKVEKVQARVKELQDEKIDLLQRKFINVSNKAVDTLIEVLLDDQTPPQTKTSTAKILLDYGGFKPIDKQETTISGGLDIKEQAEVFEKYLKGDE